MLRAVMNEAKTRNNILYLIGAFVLFFGLYVFLDFEGNTNYSIMTEDFGIGIVSIHIIINTIIAILSSVMVIFSIINFKLTKIEPKGSNAIPFFTFIFGLLTFGCTGCATEGSGFEQFSAAYDPLNTTVDGEYTVGSENVL